MAETHLLLYVPRLQAEKPSSYTTPQPLWTLSTQRSQPIQLSLFDFQDHLSCRICLALVY